MSSKTESNKTTIMSSKTESKHTQNNKIIKIIKIANITTNDIFPEVPSYAAHLLPPKKIIPVQFSFEVHGVNIAIANGLRMVIHSGVPVKALTIDVDDIEKNDVFIKPQFLLQRLRNIPLMQDTPIDTVFTVDVINHDATVKEVMSADIISNHNRTKPYFDPTITLIDLNPNKYLKLKNIRISTGYGKEYGGYAIAHSTTCLPLDQKPLNKYKNIGISSSISDPRNHLISFQTNGTADPKNIVVSACEEIIKRLEFVDVQLETLLHTEMSSGVSEMSSKMSSKSEIGTKTPKVPKHKLIVKGEDDVIGNILMKTIVDIEPTISSCVYTVKNIDKIMILEIASNEPEQSIQRAIIDAVGVLKEIASNFM